MAPSIWASLWEKLTLLHADNKAATSLHILLSVFVIHFLDRIE